MNKSVVVIGGGMAGTAAACTLTARGYDVTIVERNDYLGGRMRTHLVDNTAVEMGAGFMTDAYTNLSAFLRREGLIDKRYKAHGSAGMMRDEQIRMVDLPTLAGNAALSWRAKLQLVPLFFKTLARWRHLDPHAFYKADRYDNRSVTDMFQNQRQEILEYLIQPMLNGYFYWAPERVSEAMLFILGKAALAQGRNSYRMRGGLRQIPECAAKGSTILLNAAVQHITRKPDGRYEVALTQQGTQKTLHADGVICATTATVVPAILAGLLSPEQQAFFESIEYSSGAVLARTYQKTQTRGDKAIAFPRREGIELSAVTVAPEPEGAGAHATVKAFASGTIGKELSSASDDVIAEQLATAMQPVRDQVLVGDPRPMATHIQRWPEALPLFDVGHFKRLRSFENGNVEDAGQPLTFAGDYLGGPFMEGAFTSGTRAADRLMQRLKK